MESLGKNLALLFEIMKYFHSSKCPLVEAKHFSKTYIWPFLFLILFEKTV